MTHGASGERFIQIQFNIISNTTYGIYL